MGVKVRIVICGVTLSALLFLSQPYHASAQSAQAWDIYRLINEFRAELGLPALRYNEALSVAAVEQAERMRANFRFSTHVWADGSSPQSRARAGGYQAVVSEVIVGGWHMTPVEGMIWWKNSPIHYRELSKARYDEVGIAYVTTGKTNFYVAVLGDADLVLYAPHSVGPSAVSDADSTNSASVGDRAASIVSEQISEDGGDSIVASALEIKPENLPPPLIITRIPLSMPRADGAIVHEIAEGQALWTIAAYYKININRLLQLNGLSESDFVRPGDEIYIQLPDGVPIPTPPPTPTPSPFYTVQTGDTPSDIAIMYGISVQELYLYNGLSEKDLIFVGDELVVRWDSQDQAYPATATPDIWHRISEGDTIWTIAAQRGVSAEMLLDLNGLSASGFLSPGQRLMVATLPPTNTPAPSTVTPTPTRIAKATVTSDVIDSKEPKLASTPEPTQPNQSAPQPTRETTPEPTPNVQTQTSNASISPSLSISSVIIILFSLLIHTKTRKLD